MKNHREQRTTEQLLYQRYAAELPTDFSRSLVARLSQARSSRFASSVARIAPVTAVAGLAVVAIVSFVSGPAEIVDAVSAFARMEGLGDFL